MLLNRNIETNFNRSNLVKDRLPDQRLSNLSLRVENLSLVARANRLGAPITSWAWTLLWGPKRICSIGQIPFPAPWTEPWPPNSLHSRPQPSNLATTPPKECYPTNWAVFKPTWESLRRVMARPASECHSKTSQSKEKTGRTMCRAIRQPSLRREASPPAQSPTLRRWEWRLLRERRRPELDRVSLPRRRRPNSASNHPTKRRNDSPNYNNLIHIRQNIDIQYYYNCWKKMSET